MKKFLGLAIGLVLLGAAIVPFTSASRNAYHSYLYQQSLNKRNRRFAPVQVVRNQNDVVKSEAMGKPVFQNLRYTTGSKRDLYAGKEVSAAKTRPMSETIGFPTAKVERAELVIKNFDPINLKMQTVVTDGFSVELPEGWTPEMKNGTFRVEAGDNFAITIRRMNDVCDSVSFQTCAMTLSGDLNHLENVGGKINSLSKITRLYQKNNRHIGSFEQTETFTESFLGAYYGKEAFITRYFVQDGEGDLYLLEAIAARDYASEAVLVARQLFNSFRIIK